MQNGSVDLTPLLAILSSRLQDEQPVSEYKLMRYLQEPEQGIFRPDALAHPKTLFQSHFLLMHALYLLQQKWAAQRRALLRISALQIQKHPWPASSDQHLPDQLDALASYYLNLNHLDTSEEDIAQLLNDFWQRMQRPEMEAQDIMTLALSRPIDLAKIKLHYRRLAMRHHPDRGGDEQIFRQVQAAYQRLRQKYL